MDKYLLTIIDNNEGYCNQFFNYISINEEKRIKANFITEAEYARQVIGSGKPVIDILLISRDFYVQFVDYSNVKMVILLSDGKVYEEMAGQRVINKYQAADRLIDEMIAMYLVDYPQVKILTGKKTTTKTVGVYSPITRCGKTLCSIVAAKALARTGKQVLYLTTEDFPVSGAYFPEAEKNGMADILYFAGEKKPNFMAKFMECASFDENGSLAFFTAPLSVEDLLHTEIDAWTFLLKQVKESDKFDYIILDFQSKYDAKTLDLLNLCDELIFLVSKEREDELRVENFFKTLENTKNNLQKIPQMKILNQYTPALVYQVPEGGKGVPYIPSLVNKVTTPYHVDAESVMGRILVNAVKTLDDR